MNLTDASTTEIMIVDLFGVRGCNSDPRGDRESWVHHRVSFRSQAAFVVGASYGHGVNGLPHQSRHRLGYSTRIR